MTLPPLFNQVEHSEYYPLSVELLSEMSLLTLISNKWLSRFLLYLDPLFKLGSERTLLHSDLGFINKNDQCKNVQTLFDKYWDIEQKKPLKKQSLWLVRYNNLSQLYKQSADSPHIWMNQRIVRNLNLLFFSVTIRCSGRQPDCAMSASQCSTIRCMQAFPTVQFWFLTLWCSIFKAQRSFLLVSCGSMSLWFSHCQWQVKRKTQQEQWILSIAE